MISQEEINEKAIEYNIHTSNVQRDYIFGWLLFGLYSISNLKEVLILKGGNAFRKAYFPTTRFSNDLDFTTGQGINKDNLLNEFNNICTFIHDNTGIEFFNEQNRIAGEMVIDSSKTVYKLKLYFKDFYGNNSEMTISVRLDVTEFDKIYLPVQSRQLIHPYSDGNVCTINIQAIKLEEALADKLKCLIQRRQTSDLFDLIFSIFFNNDIEINKREIVTTFLKKTIFEPSPITAKQLLLDTPIDLMRSYWDRYIICPSSTRFDFDTAKLNYNTCINDLFQEFSYTTTDPRSYFPSEMRNKIFNAATNLKCLKMKYHGAERVIEPYSISYKRRRDGYAQEYFYAYDTTGGNTSGPGIKAFLNTDINSLEISDQTYTPRYEVELSKTGESANNTYFNRGFRTGDPFRTHTTRRTRTSRSTTAVYKVQCSYCGKIFNRYTYNRSTRLNKHKNSYGGECYGRTGFTIY